MELILKIVFFTLPLLIAVYSLNIFSAKENKKTKIKKLAIRALVILFLIILNFQIDEKIVRKDTALICATFGIAIVVCYLLLMQLTKMRMNYQVNKILNNGRRSVEEVNNFGFKINIKNSDVFYDWQNVKSVKLKVSFLEKNIKKISLLFKFNNGKPKIEIDNRFRNFYYLLKNLPKEYKSIDNNFIENLFKNLKTCPFCGLVSYYNDRCLDCICSLDFWTEEQKEDYPTIEDYIKEEQLEIFATNDKNEKFNDFKIKNLAFQQDENWKPLVSKQQVLQYSKENCW